MHLWVKLLFQFCFTQKATLVLPAHGVWDTPLTYCLGMRFLPWLGGCPLELTAPDTCGAPLGDPEICTQTLHPLSLLTRLCEAPKVSQP